MAWSLFHCVLREVAVQKGPGAVARFGVKRMWAIKSKQLKFVRCSLFLINHTGVMLDPGAVAGLGENVVLEGDRQEEWPWGNRGKQLMKIDGAFGYLVLEPAQPRHQCRPAIPAVGRWVGAKAGKTTANHTGFNALVKRHRKQRPVGAVRVANRADARRIDLVQGGEVIHRAHRVVGHFRQDASAWVLLVKTNRVSVVAVEITAHLVAFSKTDRIRTERDKTAFSEQRAKRQLGFQLRHTRTLVFPALYGLVQTKHGGRFLPQPFGHKQPGADAFAGVAGVFDLLADEARKILFLQNFRLQRAGVSG